MQTKFITKVFPEGQSRFTAQLSSSVDCLILPLCQIKDEAKSLLPKSLSGIDRLLDGALSAPIKNKDFSGKIGETLMIHQNSSWKAKGIHTQRILFVGLGEHTSLSEKTSENKLLTEYAKAARSALRVIISSNSQTVLWLLDQEMPQKKDELYSQIIRQTIQLTEEACYRFGVRFKQFKTKPVDTAVTLKSVAFATTAQLEKPLKEIIRVGVAVAQGMSLAKDLGNLPPNICNPSYLAKTAQTIGKDHALKVQILERKDMEQLGMGAF